MTWQEMSQMELEHLWTQRAPTSDGQSLGYTEWGAKRNGVPVSVACFWRSYADGDVLSSDPLDVCTNLMLVDPKGYDCGIEKTGLAILKLLNSAQVSGESPLAGDIQPPARSGDPLQ